LPPLHSDLAIPLEVGAAYDLYWVQSAGMTPLPIATDVAVEALDWARRLGADRAVDVADNPGWTADYAAGKGHFDAALDASGNPRAAADACEVLRPRGVLVQLGHGGDAALPLSKLVAREIEIRGSFRFHEEFAEAVAAINAGRIDVGQLLTRRFPAGEAVAAFELAADRRRSMKVQLDFTT